MKGKKVFFALKIALAMAIIAGMAITSINKTDLLQAPNKKQINIKKPEIIERAEIQNQTKPKDLLKKQSPKALQDNHFSYLNNETAQFGVELKTRGAGFGRVLQSFAIDEHNGVIYTAQDEANSNNNLLVNKLTPDGEYIGHLTLSDAGHGNGLGLERLPDNSIRLWTDYIPVDSKGYGTRIVRFNFDNPSEVTSFNLCPKGYKVPFVAIDNDDRSLLLRAVNPTTQDERIFIFSLDEVLKGGTTPKLSFPIDSAQRVQSFQGIHAKNNVVYILTGNSSLASPKLLYGYTKSGKVLFRKTVEAGKAFAQNNGGYYEPEGLYVYENPKTGAKRVYVGIVTGEPYDGTSNKRRINRLYYYGD